MTRVVWKYAMDEGRNDLSVPAGAEVISVGDQNGLLYAWFAVDPARPEEQRTLYAVPTGRGLPEGALRAYGTYLLSEGRRVGHVFEQTEAEQEDPVLMRGEAVPAG